MNLKAKVERLEEKVGIRETIIVVQMPGETEEEAMRKANAPPGVNVTLIKVSFGK
jgi:hypothetical protein